VPVEGGGMKALPDFGQLLEPIRAASKDLPREALPALCGALATLQAEILLPPVLEAPPPGDRALSPEETAKALGRSRDWVYRHRHELPTTRLSSGRWIVLEAKLRCWMDSRSSRRA
jgi:hypothetical protein